MKQAQKKECKRQTQNKKVMPEVTPLRSPDSDTIGLTQYNKTDSIQHNKTDPIPKLENKINNICTFLKTVCAIHHIWGKLSAIHRWFIPRSHGHTIPQVH